RREASIRAQSALMRLATSEMASLVASAGIGGMVHANGVLELYESEAELRADMPGWEARRQENIGFTEVRGADLAALQPGLSPRFVVGVFVPSWQTVSDPFDFATAIGRATVSRGAIFRRAEVLSLEPNGDDVTLQLGGGETLTARQVVVATGAWSKRLTSPLGDKIPLDTERGYNTT